MKFYKEKRNIMREDETIYLARYYIFDCPLFGLKLHKILLSDHDCVHDHPWDFVSIILKGEYVEHTEIPMPNFTGATHFIDDGIEGSYVKRTSKIYHPASILFRKAEHRHKLEIHQSCWIFVITLKRRRRWGFWTKLGWVHWKNFASTQSCE